MEQWKETPWGIIPSTWKISTVKEETSLVTDYVANGSFASLAENVKYKSVEDYAILIRLVDYNNNFQGPFVFIDESAYEFLAKSKLYGNEIIISNVGANVGTVFKCPKLKWKMSLAPNSIMVKFKGNNDFYYYWLKSKFGQHMLNSIVTGSAQPKFNKTNFKDLAIPVPPIDEQKRIAAILSSLDDKIELNRRINGNLEQQAQALFKAWFVDFEPFKNGKFVDSELGKIPEGWKVVELGKVTKHITERVGQKNDIKVLSPITTGELVLSEEYFTKQVFSENIAKYIIVKPKQFAYNPARVNIGSLGMNTFTFTGCVSPVYVVFECENRYEHFFDCLRKTKSFKEEVISRAIGGVRQSLGYKDFSLIKTIYPPKQVIIRFNELYLKLLQLRRFNIKENDSLSSLRDTLLPKLMSGELNVNTITE